MPCEYGQAGPCSNASKLYFLATQQQQTEMALVFTRIETWTSKNYL